MGLAVIARNVSRTGPWPVGSMTAKNTELVALRIRSDIGPSDTLKSLCGDKASENLGKAAVFVAEQIM